MSRPQPGQYGEPAPSPQFPPSPQFQPVPQQMVAPSQQLNSVATVSYKGGWPGLFSGENQTKAVQRSIQELNARGQKICAAVDDRWSIWKRLGMAILAVISLGFYVRSPNVILITEPIR